MILPCAEARTYQCGVLSVGQWVWWGRAISPLVPQKDKEDGRRLGGASSDSNISEVKGSAGGRCLLKVRTGSTSTSEERRRTVYCMARDAQRLANGREKLQISYNVFFSPPVYNSSHPCESAPAWKAFSEVAGNLLAFLFLRKEILKATNKTDWKTLSPSPTVRKIWRVFCWTRRMSRHNYLQGQKVLQQVFGQNKCKVLQVRYDIFQACLVVEAEYPQQC